MGPDQFPIEGPLAANALQAATVAPVAEEAWVDGAAPVYSSTDGKLHPTVVQPAGGAIVSVTGVAPIAVSPGVAPVVSLSGVVDVAHGGTASSTGDASLLTNIPAAQLSGDVQLANVAVALAAGGGPVKGTVLTATTRLDAPTIGSSSATQHALPSGTADLLSADSSAVVTNKTLSGASNTLSNIGNSSLANSSLTVTAGTGLSGGGAVSLGGSTSLAVSYGTTSTTATVGNDTRLNPAPSTAGKIPYDTGSGYSETATGGSTTTVLHGGTTPAYAAVSLTTDVSGTLPVGNLPTGTSSSTVAIGNDARFNPTPAAAGKVPYDNGSGYSAAAAGTTSQVLVGGTAPAFGSVPAAAITALTGTVSGTVTLSGAVTLSSPTLGGNLTAGSNKVTGLAAGSAAGDSLRFEQGGGVPVCFYLNTAQGWTANNYLGIGGDGSSAVNVNIVPFPVPQAGTIKNLRVQGLTNAGTDTTITIYKATSSASPTYLATALTCVVSSGTATGNDTTHSVAVSAGDLLVAFSNATWSVNGCAVSFIYLPS